MIHREEGVRKMNVIEVIGLALVFEKYQFFDEGTENEVLSNIYSALSRETKERIKEHHEHYKNFSPDAIERFIAKYTKEGEEDERK